MQEGGKKVVSSRESGERCEVRGARCEQMIKKKNSKQHKYHSFPSMGCGISVLTAMEGGNAKKCMEHLWPDTKKPQ